jgi:AcrR family transcriptional regulator
MPKTLSPVQIGNFRERLIDVAEQLFAERGPDAVSLRQLAAALEVSAMTPYRYFADKEEILAVVRARAFNRFAEALERAADSVSDVFARSTAVGHAYIEFAFNNPDAYRMMFDLGQPIEAAYPDLVRAGDRARATMTDHLQPLIAAGYLVGDPILIAHTYWAGLHGLIVLKLAGKLSPEADFDAILTTMHDALRRGFAP